MADEKHQRDQEIERLINLLNETQSQQEENRGNFLEISLGFEHR